MESYESTVTISINSRLGNSLGCDTSKQTLFLNIGKKKKEHETQIITDLCQASILPGTSNTARHHKWFLTDKSLSKDVIFYYDLFTPHPEQMCVLVALKTM